MVTVSEAEALIGKYRIRPEKITVPLDEAPGRVLAESIKTDRDMPPFDRVAMDGIAIAFSSFEEGWRDFRVEALQQAGQPRTTLKDPHNCIEVMTGAMLPIGCDTVIRYEDVSIVNKIARMKIEAIARGQSIHHRAHDAKRNDTFLSAGSMLAVPEITLLAAVGRRDAVVYDLPRIAIVSTGNELVDIPDTPLPHQIRRSNSYTIKAAIAQLGGTASLFHIADDRNLLERDLAKIINEYPVVILTGGVSKGKFDLVPASLEQVGVEKIFHEVSQKPGKPFWFGVSKKAIVFALPGNPVSTLLCFYRYILPWLWQGLGIGKAAESAILDQDYSFPADLTCFLEVKTKVESGKRLATPRPGGGSGNFVNLHEVDGFLELPKDKTTFKAGETYPYFPLRNY
ncbi:MAG TPA: molybdopterin molybdotransferase MoeA [Cyclobacteriaceae bacterium]|nr:molybdopterin molybdotransferase MoeA [Cyclobacteriaceae bacterium]